jgi:hypothetical protein
MLVLHEWNYQLLPYSLFLFVCDKTLHDWFVACVFMLLLVLLRLSSSVYICSTVCMPLLLMFLIFCITNYLKWLVKILGLWLFNLKRVVENFSNGFWSQDCIKYHSPYLKNVVEKLTFASQTHIWSSRCWSWCVRVLLFTYKLLHMEWFFRLSSVWGLLLYTIFSEVKIPYFQFHKQEGHIPMLVI